MWTPFIVHGMLAGSYQDQRQKQAIMFRFCCKNSAKSIVARTQLRVLLQQPILGLHSVRAMAVTFKTPVLHHQTNFINFSHLFFIIPVQYIGLSLTASFVHYSVDIVSYNY